MASILDERPIYDEFKFSPISLMGHTRPISDVKYNRQGDLLFTCAKDNIASVWYSHNGERLGTYNGHTGAVWGLDVNWDTTMLITGASDNTACIWDVETGTRIAKIPFPAPIRDVRFAHGDKMVLCVMENLMGQEPAVLIYDLKSLLDEAAEEKSREVEVVRPIVEVKGHNDKINKGLWGTTNDDLYTCSEDHTIGVWDLRNHGRRVNDVQAHKKGVNSMSMSLDYTMLVSGSADMTAILWDRKTMSKLKTFETSRPVNAAVISPTDPYVLLGGGQEAAAVTTTSTRIGKFEVRVYHQVFEEEIGAVKGHFGPINCLAYAPDGSGFASGAEDGIIRVHPLRK